MSGLKSNRASRLGTFAKKVEPSQARTAYQNGMSQMSDQWALVSDAIVFVYGVCIPEDRLRNESIMGKLDETSVMDAFRWAQAVVVWKTDQSAEAIWPGHITPALWPLFWEVAFRLDRERTMTAIGYALTAFAYRDYDGGNDRNTGTLSERKRHSPAN